MGVVGVIFWKCNLSLISIESVSDRVSTARFVVLIQFFIAVVSIRAVPFVLWGDLLEFWDLFLKLLVSFACLIFNRSRKPTSTEHIQNDLLRYFQLVRIILLQRTHLAARRVIYGGCRDFDHEMMSDKGLDNAVLHESLC